MSDLPQQQQEQQQQSAQQQQQSDNHELNLYPSYNINEKLGAMSEPINIETTGALYDKSKSLVDIANNTFRELCRTLETEQAKLLELEERRKKLQEEMQRLKAEIEEEKHFYKLNLVESVSENLQVLNKACNMEHTIDELIEGGTSFPIPECKELNDNFKMEQQTQKPIAMEKQEEIENDKPSTANSKQSADSDNNMKTSLKGSNHSMLNQMQNSLADSIMDQCLNNEGLIEKFEREVKKLDA